MKPSLQPVRSIRFAPRNPGVVQIVKNAAASAVTVARTAVTARNVVAPEDVLKARREVCLSHSGDCWNPDAFMGKGGCRECGCSQFKLRFSALACPRGFWQAHKP